MICAPFQAISASPIDMTEGWIVYGCHLFSVAGDFEQPAKWTFFLPGKRFCLAAQSWDEWRMVSSLFS
jgi:hypothetical protein